MELGYLPNIPQEAHLLFLLTCSLVLQNNINTTFPCCLGRGMKNRMLEDELIFYLVQTYSTE